MPQDDDDFVVAAGPLRLKGCKVEKRKKKKTRQGKCKDGGGGDLAKALLCTGETAARQSRDDKAQHEENAEAGAAGPPSTDGKKRFHIQHGGDEVHAGEEKREQTGEEEEEEEDGREAVDTDDFKTEAEKKFEEVQRKKLKKLAETPGARPELLKTHKQRVEELNTYLSKLSEHHDMPKIGPG